MVDSLSLFNSRGDSCGQKRPPYVFTRSAQAVAGRAQGMEHAVLATPGPWDTARALYLRCLCLPATEKSPNQLH